MMPVTAPARSPELRPGTPARRPMRVLITSTPSDAHTWNLVFLTLLLQESGYQVHNLGCCVPVGMVIDNAGAYRPDIIVVSSVNGHGHSEGLSLIAGLRAAPGLADIPVVIGGKLGIDGAYGLERSSKLLEAGFTAVFDDSEPALSLPDYIDSMALVSG